MFDINKCHKDKDGNLLAKTVDGRPARYLGALDSIGYRHVFAVKNPGQDEFVIRTNDIGIGLNYGCDIINIPEPKRSGEVWVDVYEDAGTITCGVRTNSSGQSQWSKRLACVRVPWTEGEGLEGK